jgi:hypothetical protein
MNQFSTSIPELPENLWPLRDAAIDHILNGTTDPDMQPIYEWLEGDGWEAMIDAWANEDICFNLKSLAQGSFNDEDLADWVTDADRLHYAKVLIKKEMVDDDGLNPSLHSYKLKRSNGDSVILGCKVVVAGQSGNFLTWIGLFKTQDDFYDYIRKSGYMIYREFNELTDEKILSLWER